MLSPTYRSAFTCALAVLCAISRHGFAQAPYPPSYQVPLFSADATSDSCLAYSGQGQTDSIPIGKAILRQPDGGTILAGRFARARSASNESDWAAYNSAVRMNPDGSWDRGWHLDIQCDDAHKTGIIKALVGDSAGNIYVGGGFVTPSGGRRNLARFNAKGELDTAWRVDADGGPVETLAIDDDGNLFVGGFFTQISGVQRPYLAKVRDGKVVGEWSRESPCQFRRWR